MARGARRAEQIDRTTEATRVLQALAQSDTGWLTATQCGPDATMAKRLLLRLVREGKVLALGTLAGSGCFAAALGGEPDTIKERLLLAALQRRSARANGLAAFALSATPKAHPDLPAALRSLVPTLAARLIARGDAVPLALVGERKPTLFVLTAALPSPAAVSVERSADTLDVARVYSAYERLAQRIGSPHVVIADLQRESGAELSSLKSWLLDECRTARALPSTGEPSIASGEQLAAALDILGRKHLMIRLEVRR